VVETIAYQAAIAQELKRIILAEDRDVRVREIKPRGDKESRLYGVAGVLESGDHIFAPTGMTELIEELLLFGSSPHDDLVDAWVHAVRECLKGRELESKAL
jgi:predicted phage terminase large subunit-like protein